MAPATELALLLAVTYGGTALLGAVLERARIPWLFGALVLGLGVAVINPFPSATAGGPFRFFAELGSYAFLFIVGTQISLDEVRKNGRFVLGTAVTIILAEAICGATVVHFLFHTPWHIAAIVGVSFATVGEAVLVPILKEFGLTHTTIGQTILGIGFVDDLFEVFSVVLLAVLLLAGGASTHEAEHFLSRGPGSLQFGTAIAAGAALVALTVGLRRVPSGGVDAVLARLHVPRPRQVLVAVALCLLLGFVGLGALAEAAALGSLLAGLAVQKLIPDHLREATLGDLQNVVYAVLGPPFFLSVGAATDVRHLVAAPLPLLALIAAVNVAKVGSTVLAGRHRFGVQRSLFMGVALTVKFSTSIVVLQLLLETGRIGRDLYSTLIGVNVALLGVPPVLAWLLRRMDLRDPGEPARPPARGDASARPPHPTPVPAHATR
jgi:Kef-type K+ transport system membrane component KefB